ncbi:hypothetical protein TCEA9_13940 [Thermobrachium celere]|nr:hypothetical protein TCEA9_13940 [Thermobrachium celere]
MKCYKQFDEREEMIIRYLPFVKYIASRLIIGTPPGIEFDDLVSYGIIGLIDAIEKYDPSKGIKFETYATLRIKGAIIDELRKISWMPKSAFSKLTQLNLAREKLEAKLNREPTEKELAEYLGVSVNEIRSTESYINYLSVVSLEDIFYKSDDEDIHFKNMIENENSPQPDKVLEEEEKVLMLKKSNRYAS